MQRCQSSIAKLVLTVLVVCNLVLAQETNPPTAQQIYEQGMEQFNAGQHEEAKKTLGRILDELDPEDIAEQDQETFWLTLQTLDTQPTEPEPVTAEQLVDQANLALMEKNTGQADALYRQVLAHADATDEHKALAIARLSDIKRSRNATLTEMRRLIKSASADIRDGQLTDAEKKLNEVQKSGVDLGWFDNNRLQHRLAVLRDRQLEATAEIEAADKAVQAAAQAAEAANVAKDLAATAAEIAQAADDTANEETLAAIAQAQSRADKAIEAAEQAQAKATEAARSAQMAEQRAGQIQRTANEKTSAMAAELESQRRTAAESIQAAETRADELEKIVAEAQAARTQQEKETATAIAEQINPRLNLAKIDLEVAKKDLFVARGELSPSASISYSLKKNEELSSTVDEREQEEVKATITWPIFKGGKNLSSVKKAKFKVEEKQLILKDVFSQVQIDTANAWTTYNSSRGILDATEAQLKAAEIANEGITLEYDTGNKRTILEVVQSRTLLLDARTSYAKAQKDFAIAQFSLLASIGDLYLDNIN